MQTRPVNMRLPQKTLNLIDKIKENFDFSSRTKVVISSINVVSEIFKAHLEGNKIIIEKSDGTKERFLINLC
jgi:hypothetical protein